MQPFPVLYILHIDMFTWPVINHMSDISWTFAAGISIAQWLSVVSDFSIVYFSLQSKMLHKITDDLTTSVGKQQELQQHNVKSSSASPSHPLDVVCN